MLSTKNILEQLDKEINEQAEASIKRALQEVEDKIIEAEERFSPKKTLVVNYNTKAHEVTGLRHRQLEGLIKIVGQNLPVLMVGSAGTGKTKAAEQTAEALGLEFYCQSVGAQTSKADLLGFIDAGGKYQPTGFRKAYENGGVFCMDEIDAGNPNVLVVLNSAIANGQCSFPDKMVKAHKDFRFIGTANTYGNGADRQYVGRNQLDAATLDRFVVVDWEIDENLEESVALQLADSKVVYSWLAVVKRARKEASEQKLRALISPRATYKGVQLIALGATPEDAYNMTLKPMFPKTAKLEWGALKKCYNGKDAEYLPF